MQIRPGEAADSGAIATLLTDLGYPVSPEFVTHSLQRQLTHADAALLVAGEQDAVIGFIALHFIPQLAIAGDFCRISYFCVDPGARGQGVGTALETAASALAWARGCDRIELHCNSRREQAHRFYHRQGYVESPKYLVKFAQP